MTFDVAAIVVGDDGALVNQLVIQPLMRALEMIVRREFLNRPAKVSLPERDHLAKTF